MPSFVRVNAKSPNLQTAGKVVKGDDYLAYLEGQHLVQEAQKNVEKIIQQAKQQSRQLIDEAKRQIANEWKKVEAERQNQLKKGYQEGLEEGKAKIAEQILKANEEISTYLNGLENEIAAIVLIALRKVLGTFSDTELVLKTVNQGLRALGDEQRITLRVSPELADTVKQQIASQSETAKMAIDIIPDHRIGSRGCVLESSVGTIDAGIDTQVKLIQRFIASRLGVNPETLEAKLTDEEENSGEDDIKAALKKAHAPASPPPGGAAAQRQQGVPQQRQQTATPPQQGAPQQPAAPQTPEGDTL